MTDDKYIHKQGKFCKDLMDRLSEDVQDFTWVRYQTNNTVIQNDIVRLRRELTKLSHMLDRYER